MHTYAFIQTLFFIILLNFLEDIMEVNYQKTVQLDTDVHSFKEKLDEFISNLIKYTLKRDPSSIKLGLIKNNNCIIDENFYNVFNQEYDSFNVKLLKFKEYFYSNIYQESYDEQDVIDYLEVAWE